MPKPTGKRSFIRSLVLSVIAMSDGWVTARYISETSGLSYKQTIDALTYLYHTEQVSRTGQKFTARWGRRDLTGKASVSAESKILTSCLLRGYMRA